MPFLHVVPRYIDAEWWWRLRWWHTQLRWLHLPAPVRVATQVQELRTYAQNTTKLKTKAFTQLDDAISCSRELRSQSQGTDQLAHISERTPPHLHQHTRLSLDSAKPKIFFWTRVDNVRFFLQYHSFMYTFALVKKCTIIIESLQRQCKEPDYQ